MLLILIILLCLPAAALAWLRWRGWQPAEAVRIGILTGVCLCISGPFINDRAMGTGEAANYSLAVADTVVQARAGTFPVYVGQSEYAFNGRVHPLRTAVYFTHVPALLDRITFRQLSFWGLQNLSLALSLWAAVFVMYACLRRVVTTSPWPALVLASLFGLSPGLLAPAYGMDLYMTVTAAPFVAIAVFGAARSFVTRDLASYIGMAVGLAGTWLAHPPVAAWSSLACGGIVLLSWLTRWPSPAAALNLLAAAAIGALLSGWAFASALSLREGIVDGSPADLVSEQISSTTKSVGWAGLLPARGGGTELGDYQLGFAGWALLLAAASTALRRGPGVVRALLLLAAFLLLLTLPVPGIHEHLWRLMPPAFGMLTNSWPMQRSYLVLATLAVFAFGHAWPHLGAAFSRPFRTSRRTWIISGLLVAWTGAQAWQFIGRGYFTRRIGMEVPSLHQSSNVDLTGIAYAFMFLPPQFHHGTRDPEQELRLLARDARRAVISNQDEPVADGPVVTGSLRTPATTTGIRRFDQPLLLEPHRRYRLAIEFAKEPLQGVLILTGSNGLHRQYQLPGIEKGTGFGLHDGNSRTLTLWTDGVIDETVSFAFMPTDPVTVLPEEFATYTLRPFSPSSLPLRLTSLVPSLTIQADFTEAGWLETPRMYVPGYQAMVDGKPVIPRRSTDGLVLVPVEAGSKSVTVEYVAPELLRKAAITTLAAWAALGLAGVIAVVWPATNLPRPAIRSIRRIVLGSALVLAPSACAWLLISLPPGRFSRLPERPGPLELKLALPVDATGRAEPLVASGQGPGSATVFIRYVSPSTVALGIDVWGHGARESEPLAIDYEAIQQIKISTGLLYDRAESELASELGAEPFDWLQSRTQIWLNGREVFFVHEPPRSKALEPFGLLRSVTGDGSYQHQFTGVVMNAGWLPMEAELIPFPSAAQLAADSAPIQLTLQLPTAQVGQAEPLLSFGTPEKGTCVFVHYLDGGHIRFGISGPDSEFVTSEPIAVDYTRPINVGISNPALFAAGAEGLPGYSEAQRRQLIGRTRVALESRWILASKPRDPASLPTGPVRFGVNSVGATYPLATFSGRFLASKRVPRAGWPVGPGNPEAATVPGTAGPIEITARLPQEMTGRQQPLLVIGKAGEGTLVIVHFQDREHIRIGVDVWNKALFWSDPIPVNYAQPQRFRIEMTSLFPASHPTIEALGPDAREHLRNTLSVAVNDRVVISEAIFSYDSEPEQMTPGRSDIGGSNNEEAFLGDILDVKRLPIPPP